MRPGSIWIERALQNLLGEEVVVFLRNGKGVDGTVLSAGEGVVLIKRTRKDGKEVVKAIRTDVIDGVEILAKDYGLLPDPLLHPVELPRAAKGVTTLA